MAEACSRLVRVVLLPSMCSSWSRKTTCSHFYLAMYWAQELAKQTDDTALAARFGPLAQRLAESEEQIVAELIAVQGQPADIGGYYQPDEALASAVMRPSTTLNEAIASL